MGNRGFKIDDLQVNSISVISWVLLGSTAAEHTQVGALSPALQVSYPQASWSPEETWKPEAVGEAALVVQDFPLC